jgi:hemoglobin
MRKNVILVALLAVAILASSLLINVKPAAAQDSLYTRLGGNAAITAVVDQFLANVVADTRINHFFANVDAARLRTLLIEQIGSATGGPEVYTGRDMKTTHAGMGVSDADFNALVEDLVAALDTFNVPEKEKGELLAILGPLKPDIVEAIASTLPATGGSFDYTGTLALVAILGAGVLGAGLVLRKRATQA